MKNKERSERKWVVKKELMRYLSISQRTIENWVNKGLIKAYKLGGRIYFDLVEIDEAITRKK